jgi:hypothetical protein
MVSERYFVCVTCVSCTNVSTPVNYEYGRYHDGSDYITSINRKAIAIAEREGFISVGNRIAGEAIVLQGDVHMCASCAADISEEYIPRSGKKSKKKKS